MLFTKSIFSSHTFKRMLILAVIQARMNSTRLPGKVLLPILDKPVIWHIYQRLKFSKLLDEICISTTTNPIDKPIIEFAKKHKIKYYSGSEKNLIQRHYGAAKKFNADIIVRITADSALVDPDIVDQTISLYLKNPNADFVSNTKTRTYPVGLDVEVFPTKTLKKLLAISNRKIFYEYFISFYIYERPEKYKSVGLRQKKPNSLRLTLDYAEDYEFIKQIYACLYKPNKIFHMNDILKLLKTHPELIKINSMHNSQFSHIGYKNEKMKKSKIIKNK